MTTFKNKQIIIDGKPIFLLSGELHYFRQPRSNWQHLLDEAKAMGLNCIASYVPWILHEEREGEWNFDDNLDLGAFIDLCHENGLYFFVRPGPFIMAEMKREGIPYWVSEKHPDAVPVGFDGALSTGTTLEYLEPGYLAECRKWYAKVMPIILPRLQVNGGNIIGIQLDNEIGMLNWVTNQPVLNDAVLDRFTVWLQMNYSEDYIAAAYPFSISDVAVYRAAFRSPQDGWAVSFHQDFGRFMRSYYASYVAILRDYALENGIHDTPFFINIHGTGEGRIFDYPLGVSQLYEAYNQGDGMISGTDVYLGDPIEGTYQDMYVSNAITNCMNKKDNPLTSIEFGCSDGPYCSLSGMRIHPAAPSQQLLLCLSQNARMISFYVFSGGENYLLNNTRPDGNERMAFTGELHGMSAPIQPDGTHNYAYKHIANTAVAIHALNELIASSYQETDGVTMAYIPDYFLTEMQYAHSAQTAEVYKALKQWRCAGAIDSIARGMLSNHVAFDAADIQNGTIPQTKLLVVLSARYMPAAVQQKLCDYITHGGNVLIYGELPEYDLDGKPCALLMQLLNLKAPTYLASNAPQYFLTINSCGRLKGIAPAHRSNYAQAFALDDDAILSPHGSDKMCGFIKSVGSGRVCAITTDYPADMPFYSTILSGFGVTPSVKAPYYRQGIYLAKTRSNDGQRLLYILNLDCEEKCVDITVDNVLLQKDFYLSPKCGYILPLGVNTANAVIVFSTAQVVVTDSDSICFQRTQPVFDTIILSHNKPIVPSNDYTISQANDQTILHLTGSSERVTVHFEHS